MSVWAAGVWSPGVWADGVWYEDTAATCVWAHGVWANGVWANGVWYCSDVTPPVVTTTTQVPAGRARRRTRRYVVEIDGQEFVVDSLEQAQALLDRAKALAQKQAQETAEAVVEKAIAKARRVGTAEVKVQTPTISAPAELQSQVDAIRQIYRDAAMAAEIQVLMALEAERDDEETILLSL